ncbi:hypothetical protein [Leptolyngbya sp. CCY15150]|uniref:hypothetical protein n=1 Tax=Leptolyngbya sp. CCY15150 TaxID=2767772 RepID=UPI00194DFA7D|nr:hypothetical protein [Leptolyngbya sp. CCY15150]
MTSAASNNSAQASAKTAGQAASKGSLPIEVKDATINIYGSQVNIQSSQVPMPRVTDELIDEMEKESKAERQSKAKKG